jgi:hypothetical protein
MGSFVNCRRRLPVSRRCAIPGLHIPVPGVGSKAVVPPDNTAQIFKKSIRQEPAPVTFPHRMGAQNRPVRASPFPTGCKTLRHWKTGGATCFIQQENK